MKSYLVFIFITFLSLNTLEAQDFPKVDVSPMDALIVRADEGTSFMRVIYSRPKKKGRVIFGDLVKYGKVWRTGANEATEITFYKDVIFSGNPIPSGTYSLFTIPGKTEWTIILNKETNLWGSYQYDSSQDLIRVKVNPQETAATIETFSIASKKVSQGYHLLLGWDNTFVEIPVQ